MRRLIVALDYGTSNSGSSYAIINDEDRQIDLSDDDVVVIKDWPRAGASRDGSEKVPSDIAYDKDGRSIGHGFEASRDHAEPLQWVKLLLEPDSVKEQSNRTSRVWNSYYKLGAQALQKRPVDVVGDYLRWLWKRVKASIIEKESEDEDTNLFEPANLTVVLTVPASWSAPAKQRMATAAVLAGIPEQCLKTLAEPEAAAVYGLKKKAKQRAVAEGDCVIICDAGGGTVDVVVYQVRTRTPLSLDQITVSKGDFCGSSFVNKEFRSQLRIALGDKYNSLSERTKDCIEEKFEYEIKRGFDLASTGNTTYYIPVDGLDDDEKLGIRNGQMKIDEAMISQSFESVMTQVMTLIDDQISELRESGLHSKLKGLLLVGGFGKNAFLRTRVKQEFPGRNDIKIWAADDAWTAVVRGAVACEASAFGRQALIYSRLSGYNYGIPYAHGGERKVHWLVRKGQSIKTDMCTEPYGLRIDDQPWLDQDETCLVFVQIVASSCDDPSDFYTDAVTSHAEIKCRVRTDLRSKPGSLEIQQTPTKAWHIPATLVLYFDGALISFRCKIEDHEVGVAEVRYWNDETNYITEEDLYSDSEPSLISALEKREKVSRADSKVSFRSGSTVDEDLTRLATEKRSKRNMSAPAVLDVGKQTGLPSSSLQSPSLETINEQRGKHFWGIRTKRDSPASPKQRRRFMGPSPLADLPIEERLNGAFGGIGGRWVPRKD